jgi:hypothetical protein
MVGKEYVDLPDSCPGAGKTWWTCEFCDGGEIKKDRDQRVESGVFCVVEGHSMARHE